LNPWRFKEIIDVNLFQKVSQRKKNIKKSEALIDSALNELITPEIVAISAKKAVVLKKKKVRKAKRLTSKNLVSRNKNHN